MKKIYYLFCALVLVYGSSSHGFIIPKKQKIRTSAGLLKTDVVYNGTPVSENGDSWKFTVALRMTNTSGTTSGCTGSLLKGDLILTAAHCVDTIQIASLQVAQFKGSEYVNLLEFSKGEFSYASNPSHNSTDHDFALIRLKRNIVLEYPDYQTINLVDQSVVQIMNPGQKVYISGSGVSNPFKALIEPRLLFGNGTISDYTGDNSIVISMNSPYLVCVGDSGSPIFGKLNGINYVVAVASAITPTLTEKCGSTLYGSYISASDYEWIAKTMESLVVN